MGVAANPAAISNDALVLPLAGAALLPVAGSIGLGRPLTVRAGAITGLLVGLSVISKSNCLALVPLVILGVVAAAWLQARSWRAAVGFLAGGAVAGAVTLAPWIAWNLHVYGAVSADDAVDAITGPLQPHLAFGLEAVRFHLRQALYGFWDLQLTAPANNPAALALFGACAVLGFAAMVRRRSARDRAALGFVAAAFPLAFLTMLAVIFVTFGGRSSVTGRHMYPAFVAVAVLLAAGALLTFGRRLGLVALASLAVLSLSNDVEATDRYVNAVYETLLADNLAPARSLSPGDGLVRGGIAVVRATCPAHAVGLVVADAPPTDVVVTSRGVAVRAPLMLELRQQNVRSVALYRLPSPTQADLTIDAGKSPTLVGARGRPIAEAWCERADAPVARFAQSFTPEHPKVLTRSVVHMWPRAWFTLAWVLLAACVASVLMGWRRARR